MRKTFHRQAGAAILFWSSVLRAAFSNFRLDERLPLCMLFTLVPLELFPLLFLVLPLTTLGWCVTLLLAWACYLFPTRTSSFFPTGFEFSFYNQISFSVFSVFSACRGVWTKFACGDLSAFTRRKYLCRGSRAFSVRSPSSP